MNQKQDEIQGLVLEIQKLSTDDGPGIRTTVFFKGCNLNCDWCHNPESIPLTQGIQWFKVKCIGCKTCEEVCPESAIDFDVEGLVLDRVKCNLCTKCVEECPSSALKLFGELWFVDDLLYEVLKDKAFYNKSKGGVTISGGEPMIQSDYVLKFLQKCKENGLHTALDTCGYTSKTNLEKILPYVDLFLYDLKEINPAKHKEFTGASNKAILDNCEWLTKKVDERNKSIWIRTPVIPNYSATDENIAGIADFIVQKLGNKIDRWDLLAFNNLAKDKYDRMNWKWKLEDVELLTREEMEHFYQIAIEKKVNNVHWSGMTKKVD